MGGDGAAARTRRHRRQLDLGGSDASGSETQAEDDDAASLTCETRDQGDSASAGSSAAGEEHDTSGDGDGGDDDEEDALFDDGSDSSSASESDGSGDFVVPSGRSAKVNGLATGRTMQLRRPRSTRRRDYDDDDDSEEEDGSVSGSGDSFIVDDDAAESDGDDEYDGEAGSASDDEAASVTSSNQSPGGKAGPATPRGSAGVLSAVATVRKPLTAAGKRAAVAKGFAEFNAAVFDGALPADMVVSWNSRLRTTAGLTYTSKRAVGGQVVRSARIELASKVLSDSHRVRSTLLHEMCHAAAWLVDGVNKPPHGAVFKRWAARASKAYSQYSVQTCHAYEIAYKHTWQCTECGSEFGRHSKSIDPEKQLCGACRGTLVYKPRRADGTPAKPRKASAFSTFVGERYRDVKKQLGGRAKHADVMRALSAEWKKAKDSGDA